MTGKHFRITDSLCGEPTATWGFPLQTANKAKLCWFHGSYPEKAIDPTVGQPVVWHHDYYVTPLYWSWSRAVPEASVSDLIFVHKRCEYGDTYG